MERSDYTAFIITAIAHFLQQKHALLFSFSRLCIFPPFFAAVPFFLIYPVVFLSGAVQSFLRLFLRPVFLSYVSVETYRAWWGKYFACVPLLLFAVCSCVCVLLYAIEAKICVLPKKTAALP